MISHHEAHAHVIASGVGAAVVGYVFPILGMVSSFAAAIISALIATGTWGRHKRLKDENRHLKAELEKATHHDDE